MLAEINTQKLKETVALAARCIDRKPVIKALASVRLDFSPGQLRVCGSNIEQTVLAEIEASGVKEEVSLLVDAQLFSNLLSRIEAETIRFKRTSRGNLTIERKGGNLEIRTADVEGYPEPPQIGRDASLSFERSDLLSALKAILCGIKEDSSPTTPFARVARFEVETNLVESKFRSYGFDGKRMVAVAGLCEKADESDKEPRRFNLPLYAARVLVPALQSVTSEKIGIAESDNHFFVILSDSLTCIFLKTTIEFPDMQENLQKLAEFSEVRCASAEFLSSLETAAVFVNTLKPQVRIEVAPDSLTLFAEDGDKGEAAEEVNVSGGKEITAHYNPDFLLPIFRLAEGEVALSFMEEKTAANGVSTGNIPLRISPQPNGVAVDFYVQSIKG